MATKPVPIRLSESDQNALRAVAQHLQRNNADTVRLLIRETYAVIQESQSKSDADQQSAPAAPPPSKI